MIDIILKSLSLTKKESDLVKQLINKGPMPASRVAQLCNIPRNTARSSLDKLSHQGILTRTTHGNTQFYQVVSQAQLIRSLETVREETLSELSKQIEIIKEYGESLHSSSLPRKRPRVQVYDGVEGLKRVYEDTLSSKTELRSWGSFDSNAQALPSYFTSYYRRRAEKNITMRSIHPRSKLALEHMKRNKLEKRNGKVAPTDQFSWDAEIQVYDNKVNIVSWKDRVALLIESDEIAHTMKSIFDLNFSLLAKPKNRD